MLLKQIAGLLKHSWHKNVFIDTFKLYSTYVFACEVNVVFLILGNSPKEVFLYETSINSVESAMCVLFK